MSKFISAFADDLDAMLSYREALGFSRKSYEPNLINFDRYIVAVYPEAASLDKEIALGWIDMQMEKSHGGLAAKATAVRLFGKYLAAVGKPAYILPEEYVSQPQTFTPYIFTDDELTRLFRAADRLPKTFADQTVIRTAPVLFRLIYTCGLRPNEGRELMRQNINFKTGEIFITKTKRKKDRIVVMSDDMLNFVKKYDSIMSTIVGNSEYFFSRGDGQAYTALQLERLFERCWENANLTVSAEKLPNVRIYDLRHRFASAVLNRWLDEKQNLYNKLPYLRAYMGHASMSETAYYIHILPENLVKSAGIDWTEFDTMIPEVTLWRE
jgi:integrase